MDKVCPKCRRSYSSSDMFCPEDGAALALKDENAAPDVANDTSTSEAEANDALIGRVLDARYRLTKLLGVGGMGRVYLAQHLALNRTVAVKVLHRSRVDDQKELDRFKSTAVHAGGIVDDHVAQVYDFGETSDGLLYLAMEYVPGDTLTRMVKKEGSFEPARVADLTRQIAKGLDAAHAQGIIHRDLKPDNIMVMRDRHGRELVKIVDFGIAKALAGDGGLTQTGAIVGTLLFMSPEQLAGGALDRRSDLYSLALVVFHMLTGALPFTGSTPEEVIFARFDTSGPRPLAAIRPAVSWPPSVQGVIDRALARDVAGRFDTASDFAGALSGAVATPLVPHAPPKRKLVPPNARKIAPVVRQSVTWLEQHRRQLARVATVGVVAILVIAAGVRVVNPWLRGRTVTPMDSLPRRTAAGEVPAKSDTAIHAPVTPVRPIVKPNDSDRTSGRDASGSRPRNDTPGDRAAALRELERLRVHLHPDSSVSAPDARAAIRQLDALLPRLHSRSDSLFAMLYQSHAYYHLGDLDSQCAVLRRIRGRSHGTRLEGVVEGYFGYGKCSD